MNEMESQPMILIVGTIKRFGEELELLKFKKRVVIVHYSYNGNDGNKYKYDVPLAAINDMCIALDTFSVGDEVAVQAQVVGRDRDKDGKNTCFCDLKIIEIKKLEYAY